MRSCIVANWQVFICSPVFNQFCLPSQEGLCLFGTIVFNYQKQIFQPTVVIILFCSLFATGCGKKSVPEPILQKETTLSAVTNFSIRFREQQLVLQWTMPEGWESDIPMFHFTTFSQPKECFACGQGKPKSVQITFPPTIASLLSKSKFFLKGKSENSWQELIITGKRNFSLVYRYEVGRETKYAQLQYQTPDGRFSPPTSLVEIHRPVDLPPPELQFVFYEKDKRTGALPKLLVEWQPKKEIMVFRIVEQENMVEQEKYMGLLLFSLDKEGREILLTENPLFSGKYLLSLSPDIQQIFGRSVDRFGNESAASNYHKIYPAEP